MSNLSDILDLHRFLLKIRHIFVNISVFLLLFERFLWICTTYLSHEPGLDLLLVHRTGVTGPVLDIKRWTSSPLQVQNFRGLVWTGGTVLPVLPIPV